jgi:hypothetical protein
MKLISIIRDGSGEIHALGSRAPDLLRRRVSSATGSAELLHVQLPLHGVSTERLCARLEEDIRARLRGPSVEPAGSPKVAAAVRRAVFRLTIVEPTIARVTTRIRRAALRVGMALGLRSKSTHTV